MTEIYAMKRDLLVKTDQLHNTAHNFVNKLRY